MDRDMRKNEKYLVEQGAHSSWCRYEEWGNMKCYLIYVFCNFLCSIVK